MALVSLLGAGLLVGPLMDVLVQLPASEVAAAQAAVQDWKTAGTLIQTGLVAWLAWRWHRVVAWGRRRGYVRREEHRAVLALRAKVIGFLVAYLALIAIGPAAIFRFLSQ